MKKVTRLRQPEGGVDIFKKPSIPKKPTQPEGTGMVKKKKLVQRQPEGSGAPKKKNKTPTSFGQAFAQARKKLGPGKTFTYKGKKYTTNRADDKKKKNMVKLVKTAVKKGRAMRAAT